MHIRHLLLFLMSTGIALPMMSFAQQDLLPTTEPVYHFLLRQELNGTIRGFHWGMLPLSRSEVAAFLDSLAGVSTLSDTDRRLLHDYDIQFSFERTRSLGQTSSFLPGFDV